MDLLDAIRCQRIGRYWRWTDEEIDLLISGQPVPSRTERACAHMRSKHGIRTGPAHHRVTAPYKPPTPIPGKIPWPAWWRRAHLMRVEGRQPTEIARSLGQQMNAVRGALYPDIHESLLRSSRLRKQRLASIAWQKKRRQVRDRERDKLRELARFEWRAAGGDPRALERYYRAFDCL